MGGKLSNLEHNDNSSSKSSQILSFHSSAKWKAYFDASKDTNKLVSVVDYYTHRHTHTHITSVQVLKLFFIF